MEEIKSKIAKLETAISSPSTPENFKDSMRKQLDSLKEQLSSKEAEAAAKADMKKDKAPEAKKDEVTAPEKKKRGRQPGFSPKKKEVEKKPVEAKEKRAYKKKEDRPAEPSKSKNEDPDCDKLLEDLKKRKAARKKAAKRYKTVSISEKVGDKIASVVKSAIDNIPAEDLKEKPKQYINKFQKVKSYVSDFSKGLKTLLGEDFDKEEIMKPFEEVVEKFIANIEKKYVNV